jgi:hypothetical protein
MLKTHVMMLNDYVYESVPNIASLKIIFRWWEKIKNKNLENEKHKF